MKQLDITVQLNTHIYLELIAKRSQQKNYRRCMKISDAEQLGLSQGTQKIFLWKKEGLYSI